MHRSCSSVQVIFVNAHFIVISYAAVSILHTEHTTKHSDLLKRLPKCALYGNLKQTALGPQEVEFKL